MRTVTLIVGCGYMGLRVAQRLPADAHIKGWIRSPRRQHELLEQGIAPWVHDLGQPVTQTAPGAGSAVFYFVPPPRSGRQDIHVRHFLQALNPQEPPRRMLYLSTTGVYGDCNGAWVDENHPLQPRVDRAFRRLDAEQQMQNWCKNSGCELVILRVAGIYGPGKLPLKRLRAGTPMLAESQAPWTNRIHADDLARVCIAAMEKGRAGEIYNVSDGQPGNMADYFNQVADFAGLPRPPVIHDPQQLSAGMRSYLAESRRIDNRKMLRELEISLEYPNLQQGLAACY